MANKLTFTSRPRKKFVMEIDGEGFELKRRTPGAVFTDFVVELKELQSNGSNVDLSALSELGEVMREMFAAVMEPKEFTRFWEWARGPDGPEFDLLIEVLMSIITDDTDRPTKRPSPSRGGPRTTGNSSTES